MTPQEQQIIDLYQKRDSLQKVANELGIHKRQVQRVVKKLAPQLMREPGGKRYSWEKKIPRKKKQCGNGISKYLLPGGF